MKFAKQFRKLKNMYEIGPLYSKCYYLVFGPVFSKCFVFRTLNVVTAKMMCEYVGKVCYLGFHLPTWLYLGYL